MPPLPTRLTIRKRLAKIVPGTKPPWSEADNREEGVPRGVAGERLRGDGCGSSESMVGSCEADEAGRPQEEQKAALSASGEEQWEHFGMSTVFERQDCTSRKEAFRTN